MLPAQQHFEGSIRCCPYSGPYWAVPPPTISAPSFNFAGMSLSTTWSMTLPFLRIPRKKQVATLLVGIAEHVGHAMMFKVLTDNTRKIIYCSNIRLADDSKTHNLYLDPINNDVSLLVICSCHNFSHYGERHSPPDSDHGLPMPITNSHDLVGHTFLLPQQEDGQCFHAHIVKVLDDYKFDLGTQPEHIRFLPMFG
jgi:hypothetical protein